MLMQKTGFEKQASVACNNT